MPKATRMPPATAPMNRRLRKKCMSSIGYGTCSSHSAKPASTDDRRWRRSQHPAGGPAVLGPGDDREDHSGHADRGEQRARAGRGGRRCGFLDSGTRKTTATRPSTATGRLIRKIAPHQKWSSSDTADQRAGGEAEGVDRAPDADRPGPLLVVEDLHDDGEGGGHQQRAADAHAGAGGDELAGRLGERRRPASRRRTGRGPRPASSCGRSGRRSCPR